MVKNSKLHIPIETRFKESLLLEAKISNITLSQLCRQKLKGNDQLTRVEAILNVLLNDRAK